MEIKVLVENTVICDTFKAEHGLCLYIETKNHKLLFDLGQSDLFLENAKLLNVDISSVDTVILSHAHYDHTGGLKAFLENNSIAKIYVNENVDGDYFNGQEKYIGFDKDMLENERLIFTKDELKIDDEIFVFTGNQLEQAFQKESDKLFEVKNGVKEKDSYKHEQYLLLKENGKNTLISGCSHKGVFNILAWAKPYDVSCFIGGFHLKDLDENDSLIKVLHDFADVLNSKKMKYYTCHCTGVEQYGTLKRFMETQLDYISTGQIIKI